MFTQTFFNGVNINSTAVQSMHVDAINGSATVQYMDGSVYHYLNVSRRAIIKFIIDDARSLGKFVNNVCQAARTKAECLVF